MPASGNVALAFGLVTAAGMATAVGASIVFCADCAKPRLLAGSLGFAAGVMLYVSFAEIFLRKSVQGFVDADYSDVEAYRYATLAFFGGFLIIAILDKVVHFVADKATARGQPMAPSQSQAVLLCHEDATEQGGNPNPNPTAAPRSQTGMAHSDAGAGPSGARRRAVTVECCSAGGACRASSSDVETGVGGEDTVTTTNPMHVPHAPISRASSSSPHPAPASGKKARMTFVGKNGGIPICACHAAPQPECDDTEPAAAAGGDGTTSREPPAVVELMKDDAHAFALKKMGLLTALAIFIHNFPEGLATFVGALADTSIGVGIAVAIAIHNIPEGICVAMPIYYATGSRWKAFMWALLSGVSEPVGAFIGWLVLYGDQSLSFALVFALVAGMMVYISIKELLPTALKYDPRDTVTTTCVVAGMVVMAASLLLFTL